MENTTRPSEIMMSESVPESGSGVFPSGPATLANAAMISSFVSMAQTSEGDLTIGAALHKRHRIVRCTATTEPVANFAPSWLYRTSPRRDGNHAPEQGPGGMSTADPCITGLRGRRFDILARARRVLARSLRASSRGLTLAIALARPCPGATKRSPIRPERRRRKSRSCF